jgi:hypothetical protein
MVDAAHEAVWSDAFWAINRRGRLQKGGASNDSSGDGGMNSVIIEGSRE